MQASETNMSELNRVNSEGTVVQYAAIKGVAEQKSYRWVRRNQRAMIKLPFVDQIILKQSEIF